MEASAVGTRVPAFLASQLHHGQQNRVNLRGGEGEMGSLNQSGFWNGNFPHTSIFPLVAAIIAVLGDRNSNQ